MTTTTQVSEIPGESAPDERMPAAPDSPGRVDIADRVVAKIAALAAGEVEGTGGVPRRILGRAIGQATQDKDPYVSARIDGSLAYVTASIAVRYPSSITQVSDRVCAHIRQRIQELCGLSVARIELEVPALLPSERPRPRVS